MNQYLSCRYLGLYLIIILSLCVLLYLPPIPQDLAYHHFADTRTFLGMVNAENVLSNAPFVLIGMTGMLNYFKHKNNIGYAYLIFFIGVFLVGFGSSYYHLHPDNSTLIWDRLPMTIGFMALFSGIVSDAIDPKLGQMILWPSIVVGLISVLYWYLGEINGDGDLRLYAWVQFMPVVVIPYILLAFKAKHFKVKYLWFMLLAYVLAKLFELYDGQVYQLTHHIVSGHTIKHILAALACYFVFLYVNSPKQQASPVIAA